MQTENPKKPSKKKASATLQNSQNHNLSASHYCPIPYPATLHHPTYTVQKTQTHCWPLHLLSESPKNQSPPPTTIPTAGQPSLPHTQSPKPITIPQPQSKTPRHTGSCHSYGPGLPKPKARHKPPYPQLQITQYLSTTMPYHFLRLSMVRIFSKAANQAIKAGLKGTLICQILFQAKIKTSLQTRTLYLFWREPTEVCLHLPISL